MVRSPRRWNAARWPLLAAWITCALAAASSGALAQQGKPPKPAALLKQLGDQLGRKLGITPAQQALIIALLALVGAGLTYVWKKRKEAAAAKTALAPRAPEPSALAVAEPIGAGQLQLVWRAFLRRLPRIYRRSILNFQPYVVLGAAGAGKSRAIAAYTDWQRQSKQFLASEASNPDLQVYLCSQAVVMEVPSKVLHDTSESARRAVLRLWRPLFRRRTPIVIVPVSVAQLDKLPPEAIRSLAYVVRGKINALDSVRRRGAQSRALEVRVLLTHVDGVDGYDSFANFAEQQNVPLRLDLEPPEGQSNFEQHVQDAFADFGKYLPLALTQCSSGEYKRIVTFLEQAPPLLPKLATFMSALYAREPLSRTPVVGATYLGFERSIGEHSNPFHVTREQLLQASVDPLRPHLFAAAGLACAVGLYFGTGFFTERPLWHAALFAERGSQNAPYGRVVRDAVRTFTQRNANTYHRYFPSFYGAADAPISARLSDNLRQYVLVPALARALTDPRSPQRKSLYYLAIIHASAHNELGAIARHLEDSDVGREVGAQLIEDYVAHTALPYAGKLSLAPLARRDEVVLAFSPDPWIDYLRRVREVIDRGYVDQPDLAKLQAEARQHLQDIETITRYSETKAILDLLPKYRDDYRHYLADIESPELLDLITPVSRLMNLIAASPSVSATATGTLLDFSNRVQSMLLANDREEVYTFAVPRRGVDGETIPGAEESFHFNSKDWTGLIRKSQVRNYINSFVGTTRQTEDLFFDQRSELRDLSMSPPAMGSDAGAIFTGTAVLKGRYTKPAIELYVRPALVQFSNALGKLAAVTPPAQLKNLEDYVRDAVEDYAQRYQRSLENFYESFAVHAPSPDAVRIAFMQLARPTSALTHYLSIVDATTSPELKSDDPTLQGFYEPLLRVLHRYAPIHEIMKTEEGRPRELDGYLTILQQISDRLLVLPPAAAAQAEAAPPEARTGELADQLSPAGRLSLDMITTMDGSVDQLVAGWANKAGLDAWLARPFLLPVDQLRSAGKRDVEHVLADVWHDDVLLGLDTILHKFPFDLDSNVEVTAEELELAFHPKRGLVFDRFRRFFSTVTRDVRGEYSPLLRDLHVPASLYPILNRIARLSAALWDDQGNPRKIQLRIKTVPFDATDDIRAVLTLVYVNFGSASIFNFNQKPFEKTLALDWTTPQTSQIGIQLTNAGTGQQYYPEAIVTRDSYFSYLHLLRKATQTTSGDRLARDLQGHEYTEWRWVIPHGERSVKSTTVRFMIAGDPLELFNLRGVTAPQPAATTTPLAANNP